jgi:hypothetical protein
MLNNILKLEGAQVLSNNEQKEVNGGDCANQALTTCKSLKAEYNRLRRLGTTEALAIPFRNFIGKYFLKLAQCGILQG